MNQCRSPSATDRKEESTDMRQQQRHAITVGMSASLTGRYGVQGRQAHAGVHAWVQDVNRGGGLWLHDTATRLPVRLIAHDDASQIARCGEVMERLIVDDRVDILLGPYSSGLAHRAAMVAEQQQQVLWNHGGSSDAIFATGLTWVVGILTPASRYFHGVIDYFRATHPTSQRVAIVHTLAGVFPQDVAAGAVRYCHEQGFASVQVYPYERNLDDFSPLLEQLQGFQPHLLLAVGRIEDDIRLAQQLSHSRFYSAAVGLIAVPLHLFNQTLGTASYGFLGPSQWEPSGVMVPEYGPSVREVMQSFRRQAPQDIDYPMAQAYAGCLVAQRCLELTGSLAPQTLRQAANRLDFTTFYGRYNIDPTTGCQVGHVMPVVRWTPGGKTIVWPPDMCQAPGER